MTSTHLGDQGTATFSSFIRFISKNNNKPFAISVVHFNYHAPVQVF